MTPTTEPAAREWTELRVLREKDGHTQRSLADTAGLSRSYYSELENGRREPNPRVIKLLATTLNVPMSMLEKRRREAGAA